MNASIPLIAAALLAAAPALAGNAVSDTHPEEAYPNDALPVVAAGPYADLVRQLQEKLHALDFDAGPANGAISTKTQAALAQFQLSQLIPASGALDQRTLLALGLDPAALMSAGENASAGGTAATQ
jgi:peptidoglycan hydrolase-like protein with peptidoglycan-binding domain